MRSRYLIFPGAIILLLGILAMPALAQDKDAEGKQDEAKQEKVELKFDSIDDLKKDYDKKYAEFLKSARAAGRDREKMAEARKLMPNFSEYAEILMEFIEKDPKSETAVANIKWAVSKPLAPADSKRLQAIVLEHYIDSEDILSMLGRSRPTEEVMMKIYEKSPHEQIKATMLYTVIGMLNSKLKSSDDKEALEKRIDELTTTLTSKFPDAKDARGVSFAARLEGQKFAAENLVIGKPVPDIVGEDIDGVEFKLSDYKGKVVVLDFWGDW